MKDHNFEIVDRFFGAHWFLTGYSCRYFSELLQEGRSKSIKVFIGVMENDVNSMIFDVEQFNNAGNFYADKLINDNKWRQRMYNRHHAELKKYFAVSTKLQKFPFSNMTDRQILKAADPVIKLQEQVRILGVMLNGLVLDGRNHLSNKLRAELATFFQGNNFDKYWPMLTQVTRLSMRQKKELEIAKLAKIAKRLNHEQVKKRLKNIYKKYCWLDYMYYGPPATWKSFEQELEEAIKHNQSLFLREQLQTLGRKQNSIIKKFHFTPRARTLVQLAQHVLWQKGWRKDVEYHGFYCYEPMLREIAKRKGEKDWRNLLYMFPWEFKNYVLHNKPTSSELKQRRSFSVLVVSDPKHARILTGKIARKFYKQLKLEKDFSHITEVTGQCAFAGKVSGRVKIVQIPADMVKMHKGDILVSQATSPDLLPAMKKAAGIVTNTGGLICHAAITSRELKIPCVVGTTSATMVFKDGDMVEVDAMAGVIKKIVR